jgi:hypothetical protein
MAATVGKPLAASQNDAYDASPVSGTIERTASAVSWPSIIGGAVSAAAISMILLELGAGLGLAMVSPWPYSGLSPTSFSIVGGIWLIVVQWIAAGIGGYLAGRLRTKWVGLHSDEVFFRDTAHGFLSWALATVIGALFIACVAIAAVSSTAGALSQVAVGAAQTVGQGAEQRVGNSGDSAANFVDAMFRPSTQAAIPDAVARDARLEARRILVMNLRSGGDLATEDRTYLGGLVAAGTGLSQADAERRVDEGVTQIKAAENGARDAANAARKAAASAAIATALAMLIGAFIASAAGALGGRRRDEY